MRPSNSLIANGVSCSNSFNSNIIYAWDIVRGSYQVVLSSGNMSGTFVLQGSNDIATGANPNQFTPTNWNTISSTTTIIASTSAASFITGPQELAYNYLRVSYTKATGADGVISIRFQGLAL